MMAEKIELDDLPEPEMQACLAMLVWLRARGTPWWFNPAPDNDQGIILRHLERAGYVRLTAEDDIAHRCDLIEPAAVNKTRPPAPQVLARRGSTS